MKKYPTVQVLVIAALCLAVAFSGCGSGAGSSTTDNTTTPSPSVHVTADITTPTTWTHNNTYVVDNSIATSATLTIEPGTIVKFEAGAMLTAGTNGTIIADGGSASTPIIFTSIKDDTYGGDTNGDGNATAARGDWNYIRVTASGSVFNHCRFSYAGAIATGGALAITNDSTATVTNCVFAHNQGGTLTDTRAAALNATFAGAGTVITGNAFYDNDMPLAVNGRYNLDNSNVFHYVVSAGTPTITNKYNGIFFSGNYSDLTGDITWSNTDAPYVILRELIVAAGSQLTLGDKVIVKFDTGKSIDADGTLMADAETGIVFTSIKDDSVGGDTNGDGAATTPLPGDWLRVQLSASGSKLNKCRFSYGGSASSWGTVTVSNDSTATITNCTFAHNKGGTPDDNRGAALNLVEAVAGSIITGNTFYDNDMPLVINAPVDIDNSNVFHMVSNGTATVTNKYNGIFVDGNPRRVTGNVTWSNTEVPYVIYNYPLWIGTQYVGASLTLGDNVVLKFWKTYLAVYDYSTLSQGTGNCFTSLNDDSLRGDTWGDGATTPAQGDWTGIALYSPTYGYATWGNILYATIP